MRANIRLFFHAAAFSAVLIFFSAAVQTVSAQGSKDELRVGYQGPGKIDIKGFTLKENAAVKIECFGGEFRKLRRDMLMYAWMLNSESREVVWSLITENDFENEDIVDSRRISFSRDVTLPAGRYEVYYSAGMNYSGGDFKMKKPWVGHMLDLIDLIFNEPGDKEKNFDKYKERLESEYYCKLTGPQNGFTIDDGRQKVNEIAKNALVSMIRAEDDEKKHKSFSALKDVKLQILAVGEQSGKEQFDYAWIMNSETYERVWPDKETKFIAAGGGKKNRKAKQTIILPKGNYTVRYISDDSHSFEGWNVPPPSDPQMWGITIWTENGDKKFVKPADAADPFALKLFKAKDDAYMVKGFSIAKDMKVRVISLGEKDSRSEMADYGWIVNSDNHETVWEFTEQKSEHAGGAEKNRMVNEEIELKKGNYTAYYVADDSHAYDDWNDAAPIFPELWGLGIIAARDRESFIATDSAGMREKNLAAEIVKVGDDQKLSKPFSLKKESKLRVYAIGEGMSHELSDYGWITNKKTGKVVWEMTYRITNNAGGNRKNRLVDTIILLPAGDYQLNYETDDSHSYRDWNTAPPYDQEHYGISVYLAE